jgi:carbon monoxide dehydrogenase subunit G
MELTNVFTIALGIDETFEVLTDLERVAPCMPGATLEEVEGGTYSGRGKVKVGPMSLTYAGSATLAEQDKDAHTARIEASGREKRGAGTASADVRADLAERDGETVVTVVTDINITGKAAQFGRGVMADVGAKIIDRFAENLREDLMGRGPAAEAPAAPAPEWPVAEPAVEPPAPAAEKVPAAAAEEPDAASTGPRRVESRPPRDEALDLMDVAGKRTIKRLVPVLAGAIAALLMILWRRHHRN